MANIAASAFSLQAAWVSRRFAALLAAMISAFSRLKKLKRVYIRERAEQASSSVIHWLIDCSRPLGL